ncbi:MULTISPECIES: tail fiber assembly protein [unclassified Serratia (in: enterobacteria)]|uniref:tail fiber assembly protein n=1 Tax=unclassified Serratia (in: enterobacteria) TaxID=2647522 RepID=UPI0027E656B0|nr:MULTISPECIES: tail fiber assembly protein [unclassified Serratia (in: enterobacteria)]MDQ7097432.1 tail fiber assembly protein [Serratia sp. MF2]MDQ7104865.1 tail fiber assembly protein [Serratia sp. MF1(2023)]
MSFIYSPSPQALWLYQYDADGTYIGSVFMTIPANMGLPANTTHIPCECNLGETGIFNDGAWRYVKDIRGTQYWNARGQGFVISSLQESLPDWAVNIAPPVADAGCVLLFTDGQWWQIEDRTGQAFYEGNGNKHIVPDAYYILPEGCTFIAPPEAKPTFVTQWNGTEWIYVKDLRGQLAYNTETKDPLSITEVGPVPDGYTLLPPGRFEQWEGQHWVKDEFAERVFYADQAERKKTTLLAEATEQIAVLTYAISKGTATDSEIGKLALWEEYRLAVNRVDTTATVITWPEKP